MSQERRTTNDRRSGPDRRQNEDGPLGGYERRRAVEPRQPLLTELHLSDDELKALGFMPTPSAPGKPR